MYPCRVEEKGDQGKQHAITLCKPNPDPGVSRCDFPDVMGEAKKRSKALEYWMPFKKKKEGKSSEQFLIVDIQTIYICLNLISSYSLLKLKSNDFL